MLRTKATPAADSLAYSMQTMIRIAASMGKSSTLCRWLQREMLLACNAHWSCLTRNLRCVQCCIACVSLRAVVETEVMTHRLIDKLQIRLGIATSAK